jgi:hypothetical protein
VTGVRLHPHAQERIQERGATKDEIVLTVAHGEQFPARFGRTGFRRSFSCHGTWRGRRYSTKQVEAYAVAEGDEWLVITAIVKYFE